MFYRRSLLVWALFCVTVGLIFVVYALTSLAAGRGELVLPLDDVYIHFQYARQLANGQPFVYNPGQPPTSGATSFLYPFILAFGYLLGFQGLNLALWAMIVGALALLGSMVLMYRLVKIFDSPDWLAVGTALIFALTGAVSWHFMSGMETGLMMLLTLATLYMVISRRFWAFMISASLLALMRPEGGILSVLAVGVMVLQIWTAQWAGLRPAPTEGGSSMDVGAQRDAPMSKWRYFFLIIPILMLGVQPLVNWLVTGSAVASGNAAKSILGTIPFDWGVVLQRILENFARMWIEWVTGYSPREGLYLPFLIGALAMIGLVALMIRTERRLTGFLILAWLGAGTVAVSTLDTAFWHFKRYQMPFIALLFPLSAWVIQLLYAETQHALRLVSQKRVRLAYWRFRFYFILVSVTCMWTSAAFLQHFALNVDYVYRQPLQMARWLQANTPEDAVIAVHDVGMMRYMGGRATLDMVGLTTPGAADYWRNGPGSVAEFLIRNQPDYIASYGHGHGYGLGMIADTDIYGEPLASFPVNLDSNYNVALAADFQGIYKPDWSRLLSPTDMEDMGSDGQIGEFINVADLKSEKQYEYQWNNRVPVPGFVTGVYQLGFPYCADDCKFYSATRHINGTETFVVNAQPDENALLYTVIHPLFRGQYDVYINDALVDRNWIPAMPGYWLIEATFIPARFINTEKMVVRIESDIPDQGYYAPAFYWLRWEAVEPEVFTGQPIATFQDGAIVLAHVDLDQVADPQNLNVNLSWYTNGGAQGDYKVFVHVLDAKDEIIAQADAYAYHNSLPPGNWLPGNLQDQMAVNLDNVPPGLYRVAIGFYNPYTFERLIPQSDTLEVSPDNRLFIGNLEVK